MSKFINGGFFANRKTQIMTGLGIISALCAYMVGDSDLFATIQALIAVCGFVCHNSGVNSGLWNIRVAQIKTKQRKIIWKIYRKNFVIKMEH